MSDTTLQSGDGAEGQSSVVNPDRGRTVGRHSTSSEAGPLVSVVIPTYRRLDLLKRAVTSVLAQTYPHWELIVSDDEPEGGEVWAYLQDLARRDPRVQPVQNTTEHGQVGNTNNGLRQARGEWIKLLHDDDVLKPTCLEELLRVVESRPNVATVTCGVERYEDGRRVDSSHRSGWPLLELIPQDQIRRTMYLVENTGGALPSQKLLHRRVIEAGALMEQPEGLRWMVDSWFNVRVAACGDLLIYRKPLVEWHQGAHTTETSLTSQREQERELDRFKELLWEVIGDRAGLPDPRVMKEVVIVQRAAWQFQAGDIRKGFALLRQVRVPSAFWQFGLWSLHHATKGRFARTRRIRFHRVQETRGRFTTTTRSTLPRVKAHRPQRIAILYSRLSGYTAACLKALKEQYGTKILVVRVPPVQEAPFDSRHFAWIDALHDRNQYTAEELWELVSSFSPDAVFMSGWMDPGYLKVGRRIRQQGVPVIAGSDAQWAGTLRQQVGRVIAPWHLHSAIDILWVAGERQRQLAYRLGFRGRRCWTGYYACDWERFAAIHRRTSAPRPRAFLYTGRYVPVKGLDILVEAYERYRSQVADPWSLICVGAGDQKNLLVGVEGVTDRGFLQPDELPEQMAQVAAFVLPSKREPWGVVVQEAAAAGLPLICSDVCGAAVHLLQDGFNGYVFESGNVRHLAECMVRMSELSEATWEAMSRRSHQLSAQYTPRRWADTLVDRVVAWSQHSA